MLGLVMPLDAFRWLPGTWNQIQTSRQFCTFLLCWIHVTCFASLLHILVIAIDRYLFIVWPFFYKRTVVPKVYVSMIAWIWLVSGILGSIPAYIIRRNHQGQTCDPIQMLPREYYVYFDASFLFTVYIATLTFYLLVTKLALEKIQSVVPRLNLETTADEAMSIFLQKFRTLRQSVLVFIAFVLCWTPHFVVYIVQEFTPVSLNIRIVCTTWAFLHSGVNFFVYVVVNKQFRDSLKKTFHPKGHFRRIPTELDSLDRYS